ncbi:MAG: hypothetical protein M1495_18700 [Bacteroidetes bacterium]|nr:hypothetical protein [Bacteroidota bacterium]
MEDQMTPRLKRSVLLSLINSARGKFPNVKEKIQQWQIEQELGRLFEKTKTGSRREKEILRFAEANKLMIVIPE